MTYILYLYLLRKKTEIIYVHTLIYNKVKRETKCKKIDLEHFCLLIPAEWSAVFNTSSRSETLKKILMIFLVKQQAARLFRLTYYWFPRRRFPVKSSVPKVAAKSLNIFEFQVLVKLQAFNFTKNYLLFLVFFQGVLKADLQILSNLRWKFEAVVDRWKSLSIFAKASIF